MPQRVKCLLRLHIPIDDSGHKGAVHPVTLCTLGPLSDVLKQLQGAQPPHGPSLVSERSAGGGAPTRHTSPRLKSQAEKTVWMQTQRTASGSVGFAEVPVDSTDTPGLVPFRWGC